MWVYLMLLKLHLKNGWNGNVVLGIILPQKKKKCLGVTNSLENFEHF